MELSSAHQAALLKIAADVIRATLTGKQYAASTNLDPALTQPAGCFVSLHDASSHRLRGCIGTMDASKPLINAVAHAAASVLDDPRFAYFPVTLGELPDLTLEISALSPLKPAPDPLSFDPLNDGIYLTIVNRHGVFLPQVARETGWDKEQLLARLCTEKMGLDYNAWQSPDAKLETFSTLIIGPAPFPTT